MNTDELTMLLARIQVIDNRQVDALTIEAWTPLMSRIDYADAVQAVNHHFTNSTDYLQPAHIRAGVARVRSDREREESRQRAMRPIEPSRNTFPGREVFNAMVQQAIAEQAKR